jgi:integrase
VQTAQTYRNFIGSLSSPVTRKSYKQTLRYFCRYVNVEEDNYDALLEWIDSRVKKLLESDLIEYILHLKDIKKLSPNSVSAYLNPIRHFFKMNDILTVNWHKVNKFQGKKHNIVEDKPYTREQIQKLLEVGDLRDRVMLLLMVSAGCRVGALSTILLKDLTPIDKYNLYQIKVYARTESSYVTFCTPECRRHIDEYLQFRKRYGERLKPDSPLLRHGFNINESLSAAIAKPIKVNTLHYSMLLLIYKAGIRAKQVKVEGKGFERTDMMLNHACRKFFSSSLESEGVNPVYIDLLLGHDMGLKSIYSKPSSLQLLEDNGNKVLGYAHGINTLTINEENRLKSRITELAAKQDEIMLMRLKHEQEMKSVREEMHKQFDQIMVMIQQNPKLANIKPEALVNKTVNQSP